jgi:ABC-type lipoprotein export system ATPase subunit
MMLSDLHCKEGKTIVMVTHDANVAKYAERTVNLKDGKVVSTDENPEHTYLIHDKK